MPLEVLTQNDAAYPSVCMYKHICHVYVCIYIYTCVYVCVCVMYAYVQQSVCICMGCVNTYMDIYTHVLNHRHVYLCIYIYIILYTYVNV